MPANSLFYTRLRVWLVWIWNLLARWHGYGPPRWWSLCDNCDSCGRFSCAAVPCCPPHISSRRGTTGMPCGNLSEIFRSWGITKNTDYNFNPRLNSSHHKTYAHYPWSFNRNMNFSSKSHCVFTFGLDSNKWWGCTLWNS